METLLGRAPRVSSDHWGQICGSGLYNSRIAGGVHVNLRGGPEGRQGYVGHEG